MFKYTANYTDYNGEERKEDCYFNLNKAELLELQMSTPGGLEGYLEKIIKTKDQPELIKIFKKILLLAYGEKTPDGRSFMKSDDIRLRFECSEAYSELFMKLATDSDFAAEFVNSLLPADFQTTEEERKQAELRLMK